MNLLYASSYDRGLQYLLFMWEDIKKKFPEAQLHIAYGWNTFDSLARGNPERQKWKKSMVELMGQPGITEHGRVGKEELKKLRKECGILAYPTDFFEINCITALECQKDGCVPVVMNPKWEGEYCALDETVFAGVKVDGDIHTEDGLKAYLESLTDLMSDSKRWLQLSRDGVNSTNKYSWRNIASKWTQEFAVPVSEPLVSIITPTIRKGFWATMASNIATQTYKNVEWIVVDDYPKDRKDVMLKACAKWGLKHKYVRGGKSNKFHYGLSTANNLGWKNSNGELLIWLQDFVYMPENGVEKLVDIYRHNPNALIAPTDTYYYPKFEPNTNSEDWFDGRTDVVGDFSWDNNRNKFEGARRSEQPSEFEMNYGAIPRAVLEGVGGWYEFFNDGLGFDNTEFAYRALKLGYELIVDDSNRAIAIDHWKALENKQDELGEKRTHRLNDPRFYWMLKMIDSGKLGLKRDEKVDTFRLDYTIPDKLDQKQAVEWMRDKQNDIIKSWENVL